MAPGSTSGPTPDLDAPEVDTCVQSLPHGVPDPPRPLPGSRGGLPSSRGSARPYSTRSGLSQAYAESETAFTTGIAVDLESLQARVEEDALCAEARFLDSHAVMHDIYDIKGSLPQMTELLRAPGTARGLQGSQSTLAAQAMEPGVDGPAMDSSTTEGNAQQRMALALERARLQAEADDTPGAQLAWAEAEEAAGIPAYRQACAERSIHPSTVVIAALLRSQRDLRFSGAHLGPLGMECVCSAMQSAFLKEVESLDLARAWISPVGLVHLASTLLGIDKECLADPGYTPDSENKASHELKALDLSYNGLGTGRQIVLSDPSLLPMVSREAEDYAVSERKRVEGVLDKLRRGEPLEEEDPEEAKKAGKKKEGPVDPYQNVVRATALLGYAKNNPRPFNPPPKISAEEAKKRERGNTQEELPPDPTLADDVPLYEKLQRLNLRSVDLAANSLKILAAGCPGLTTLILRGNDIDDAFATDLVRSLAQHESLLLLDLSQNAIGDTGAVCIAAEIPQFVSLRELRLGDNQISYKGAAAIAAGLCKASAKGGMTLESLSMSGNRIGDWGGAFLMANVTPGGFASPTLAQEFNKALLEIVSTVAPVPAAFKQLKGLKPCETFCELSLERCGLGTLSAVQACKLLPSAQSIQMLELEGNSLGGGLGFYGVLRALVARRDSLKEAGVMHRFTATLQNVDLAAEVPQDNGGAGDAMSWEEVWRTVRGMAGDYVEELVIRE